MRKMDQQAAQAAATIRASNATENALKVARANAASDADVVRGLHDTIARIQSDAAANTCESVRERDTASLGLLAEGTSLLAEGVGLVERLNARITGLQDEARQMRVTP